MAPPKKRWMPAKDGTYEKVLRCLAENPGWVNHIIAMELGIPRSIVVQRAKMARQELTLAVSKDACSVLIRDKTCYDAICRRLGVTPVATRTVTRTIPTADGRVIGLRANPYDRRGKPPPDSTDPFVHLLRLLRDEMRRRGICRVTISPDSTLVGRIVDTPLP